MKRIACGLMILALVSGCSATKNKMEQSSPNSKVAIQAIQTPDLSGGKEKAIRQPHALTLAQLHQKYKANFLFNGPRNKNEIALTFDDVPDTRFTGQVLDILKKYGVKATFFAIGNRAHAHPELIKRIINEGHEIGNHTYTHPNLVKVNEVRFRDEVNKTENVLTSILGYSPKLFRPPYGNIDEPQLQWLITQGYKIINWNADSLDWKGLNADQIKSNVLGHTHPGSIVLQHAGGGKGENLSGTIAALPDIIQNLQAKGIKFVTLSKLLNIPIKK